jgi:hypothetical protein
MPSRRAARALQLSKQPCADLKSLDFVATAQVKMGRSGTGKTAAAAPAGASLYGYAGTGGGFTGLGFLTGGIYSSASGMTKSSNATQSKAAAPSMIEEVRKELGRRAVIDTTADSVGRRTAQQQRL